MFLMPYFFKMPPRLIIANFNSPDVSHVLSFDCKIVNTTKSKQIKIQSQVYCDLNQGAFFWDYSGIGILGTDGICVLLGAIPFSE